MFTAHIRRDKVHQSCTEHSVKAALYASEALLPVGLKEAGFTAGILHDAGKFSDEFNEYIIKAAEGEAVRKGSVIHTFAAVRYLLKKYHPLDDFMKSLTSEILAYAAGAHHGLFDCIDENGESGFDKRIEQDSSHSDTAVKNFFNECITESELEGHFFEAKDEINKVFEKCRSLSKHNDELQFYLSLLSRLILSAVIEGDRRDTFEFMNETQSHEYGELTEIWENCLGYIESKLSKLNHDTPINAARQQISDQCRQFAADPEGIYRLNVPTGGGKTLSCLRYAVAHAKIHKKRRLIFTSPLLSILDQNAAVIREYIGDDSIILEHHSNVVNTVASEKASVGSAEPVDRELDEHELLCENWNVPIVITTLVQLLNTMFDGGTSSIRRFHALCDSVIVIDEVQTVPPNMLTLFNLTCNFLAYICGATIVMCSATQPCFEKVSHSLILKEDCDIIPYNEAIWSVFKRTEILNAGKLRLDEIPDFAYRIMSSASSLLIVCNKKDQAETLWTYMKEKFGRCYHLSASMCMAHRKDVLKRVRDDLAAGYKVVLVSTQVIEAGVDISFGSVIRLCAGMDSVIQAAGRCNRNGESETPMPVYIVNCADENLAKLEEIRRAKSACISLIADYETDAGKYANDLSSDKAIGFYYRTLFKEMPLGYQDYCVNHNPSYYSLTTSNDKYLKLYKRIIYMNNTAMKKAGKLFEVFDSDTYDVIIPYGDEGKKITAEFLSDDNIKKLKYDMKHLYNLIQQAKPYTVSLYGYQYEKLRNSDFLLTDPTKSVTILKEGMYDNYTGIITDPDRGINECGTTIL